MTTRRAEEETEKGKGDGEEKLCVVLRPQSVCCPALEKRKVANACVSTGGSQRVTLRKLF